MFCRKLSFANKFSYYETIWTWGLKQQRIEITFIHSFLRSGFIIINFVLVFLEIPHVRKCRISTWCIITNGSWWSSDSGGAWSIAVLTSFIILHWIWVFEIDVKSIKNIILNISLHRIFKVNIERITQLEMIRILNMYATNLHRKRTLHEYLYSYYACETYDIFLFYLYLYASALAVHI